MTMLGSSFYLLATEPEGCFDRRVIRLLKRATVGTRDDFFWCELDREFEESAFGPVLIATRHFGYVVSEVFEMPLDVYVCWVSKEELILADSLSSDDVSIMAWGLLLQLTDNRTSVREIYESSTRQRGNLFYVNPVKQ